MTKLEQIERAMFDVVMFPAPVNEPLAHDWRERAWDNRASWWPEMARAALLAVREPNEAMSRVMLSFVDGECELAWQAAIDAILNEKSE